MVHCAAFLRQNYCGILEGHVAHRREKFDTHERGAEHMCLQKNIEATEGEVLSSGSGGERGEEPLAICLNCAGAVMG